MGASAPGGASTHLDESRHPTFSTQQDGDTLFAASTQEVENKELGSVTMGAIASEIMWDAILASVPVQQAFVPSATPLNVGAATLALYVGRYDFAPPKDVGDMQFGTIGATIEAGEGGAKILNAIGGTPAQERRFERAT